MGISRERIEGAIYGLAFGDGIAAPSATNRLGILAPKRIMRMRSLSEFADEKLHTTRPIPYTHAQPSELLDPRPSDDTEWFAFVLKYLSQGEKSLDAWRKLAQSQEVIRARLGTKIALKNLSNGLMPPASGHDNPHYLDDISLIRAIAVALLFSSDNQVMMKKIDEDVTITHSEDGLYCARAAAVLVAAIIDGASKTDAIRSAQAILPKDSWSERLVRQAMEIATGRTNTLDRAMALEIDYVEKIYAYPISAPETLGLLLAHFANTETPEELVHSSLLHKRKLDSLPPLAGVLAGVFYGVKWLPKISVNQKLTLDGVCIPDLKGMNVGELVDIVLESKK